MALRGTSLVETIKYHSQFDEATEDAEKTGFLIGAIDVAVRSHIQDHAQQWMQTENGMQMTMRGSWRNFEIVRFGLKGIENYKDDKGNDIPFTTQRRAFNSKMYDVASDEFIATLEGRIVGELADKIIEINTATEAERKKSATP